MKRFWEIDLLRGLAIVNMVIFNYSFALTYLGVYSLNLGINYAYVIASTFIFLSGISLTLTRSQNNVFRKFLFRGAKIFALGLGITIVTCLAFPEAYIRFGILHFIGLSTILGYFFLRFKQLNIILGALLIVFGFYLMSFRFDFNWAFWLGFVPQNFRTFDYFPLLPWFGVILLGISFGKLMYKDGKRQFKLKDFSENYIVRLLSFLGRNSLMIYLLHQPVLILILLLFGIRIF